MNNYKYTQKDLNKDERKRQKIEEISRKRQEGKITVEEAREQSPLGWWQCDECGWDGAWTPVDLKGALDSDEKPPARCPDCGSFLDKDDR